MTPHETDSTRTSGAARAHAPRRRRRTRAPMPATGATRGPVRGVGGRGGGARLRRWDRAPWASGGPDGGRGGRPETDAHRGIIGRSWPAKNPLRARYAATVDRRPIRRSADPHGPGRSGPTGRLGCPSPPHIPLPCRAHRSECGPTAARPRRCCTNRDWPARCPPTGSSLADAI